MVAPQKGAPQVPSACSRLVEAAFRNSKANNTGQIGVVDDHAGSAEIERTTGWISDIGPEWLVQDDGG